MSKKYLRNQELGALMCKKSSHGCKMFKWGNLFENMPVTRKVQILEQLC